MEVRPFTDEEIESYQTRGAAFIPQLIDADTVRELLALTTDEDRPQGRYKNALSESGSFFEERFLYQGNPGLTGYVLDQRIGENVGKAMGADSVRVLFDHLLCCGPNTPVDYYWHQDLSYWPIDGNQICSIWLTLTDCDVESSALEIVLDSDEGGIYPIRPFGEEDFGEEVKQNYDKGSIPKYDQLRDKYDILSNEMKAGDAYLFNAKVMHSSAGNRSSTQGRVAYSVRYIGDDVTWFPRPAFDQEALTPAGRPLERGEKFVGAEYPEIWRKRM